MQQVRDPVLSAARDPTAGGQGALPLPQDVGRLRTQICLRSRSKVAFLAFVLGSRAVLSHE